VKAVGAALLISTLAFVAHAHESVKSASPMPSGVADSFAAPNPKQRAARVFFSDRRLLTHRGEEVAFYSDVLRDKVILINFVFTQCTDTCPTQTARVAEVQSLLGERVGRDIELVSISVDPEHDTPEVLRDYATRFGAGDGWIFLTGKKPDVDDVRRRLAQLSTTREAHTTLFILGNVKTGHWMKMHPDAAPKDIARHLQWLAAETDDGSRPGLQ